MEDVSPALVICLTLGLVVAINAGLVLALRGRGSTRQIEMLQRAARTARDPFREQRDSMAELRERVEQLTEEEPD